MGVTNTAKSLERWDQCVEMISDHMKLALYFLYVSKYGNKVEDVSMKEFLREAQTFAVKRIKAGVRWSEDIKKDLVDVVTAIKVVTAYSNEYFLDAKKIEEFYAQLQISDDQNFLELLMEIRLYQNRVALEPPQSERRKIFGHIEKEVLFISAEKLYYPFYHSQRPRFFNAATVENYFFERLEIRLRNRMKTKHKITDFAWNLDLFWDSWHVAYEFYEEWLKARGEDLELGAHRLSNKQLFWVAAVRSAVAKQRYEKPEEEAKWFSVLNRSMLKRPGFVEAFHCN